MTEYYQNRDIVTRFDVFEDGDDVTPVSASVLIYGPDKEYIGKEAAKIEGNEVRHILKGSKVKEVGKYTFIFKVTIKKLGDYTHIVKANVQKLPIPIKGEEG